MDEKTYKRLKNNPFYILSAKQKAQMAEYERQPMIQFGQPDINTNEFTIHPPEVNRVGIK